MTFLEAALVYLRRGYLAQPLALDSQGFAKRPLVKDWPRLERTEAVIRSLPWDRAKGLGLILGTPSSGLCALDVDDEELFSLTILALGGAQAPRLVQTARRRGHVFFQEIEGPSPSSVRTVEWRGRRVSIELKANGTQVASPPTPKYRLLTREPPKREFTIESAFEFWRDCIWDTVPRDQLVMVEPNGGAAGYPKPWAAAVPEGQRNQSLYIEAHRLREAGMPLEEALEVLAARVAQGYAPGLSQAEAGATIGSAYRKGLPPGNSLGPITPDAVRGVTMKRDEVTVRRGEVDNGGADA